MLDSVLGKSKERGGNEQDAESLMVARPKLDAIVSRPFGNVFFHSSLSTPYENIARYTTIIQILERTSENGSL